MSPVFTSSVLIQIGEALASSHVLRDLSIRYFGRGIKIVVGGYAQKLAADEDAPFIWVYSEEDDSNVNGEGAVGFTAKIVLGICPQKDVPSTTTMFELADGLVAKAEDVQSALVAILDELEEGTEIYEEVSAVVDASASKVSSAKECVESARTSASTGSFEEMFGHVESEMTNVASVIASVGTVAGIVGEDPEFEELVEAAEEKADEAETASGNLEEEVTKVQAEIASFIEDPFISEVVKERTADENGLMIYGAIRTIDLFKNQIISRLNRVNFGIPLESIQFKNQAVAHYPLDWSEITAHFKNTETLGL